MWKHWTVDSTAWRAVLDVLTSILLVQLVDIIQIVAQFFQTLSIGVF